MSVFQTSRADGRSDRRVVFELTAEAEPEELFTHERIVDELAQGIDGPVSRARVYKAVGAGNRLLLRERRRFLAAVRGAGYRVARADEHALAAIDRRDRATTQMQRGLELLENVRWNELDENQQQLHRGHLLVMDGLYRAVQASHRRHAEHDALIASLVQRVETLEDAGKD